MRPGRQRHSVTLSALSRSHHRLGDRSRRAARFERYAFTLREETDGDRAGFFELTALELRSALLQGGLELGPILDGHLVLLGQQDLDVSAFEEICRLIEDDLSVLNMSS